MAAAARPPPRARDPVSPINILAGFLLNTRNPRHPPHTAAQKYEPAAKPYVIPTTEKNKVTRAVDPDARPSSPSVKFTAFVIASITKTINGIYHIPKSAYISAIGIYTYVLPSE